MGLSAKGLILGNESEGGKQMQYRKFGKLDWKPSALGFGCMRLPTMERNSMSSPVNEDESIRMIRYAIDEGVNYLDTAYVYHSGQSEKVLGKALQGGYRERVKIATKSPMMIIRTADDYDRILDEQLEKLGVDIIDFYLFHGLSKATWEMVKDHHLLERAEAARQAGKIGHIGFSFHDQFEVFEDIINGYDSWDFCQIQYNYMDTENQAGTRGLRLAAAKGLGVVVMEPLLGGKLANPPEVIKRQLEDAHFEGTATDLALQWLWSQPEVSVVLSGMTQMEQVVGNILSADRSRTRPLSNTDLELIRKIRTVYEERTAIPCTACGYCMPCPNLVNIPMNIKFYNDGVMYDCFDESQRTYRLLLKPEFRASACTACMVCEEKCPQQIPISEWMPKIQEKFE